MISIIQTAVSVLSVLSVLLFQKEGIYDWHPTFPPNFIGILRSEVRGIITDATQIPLVLIMKGERYVSSVGGLYCICFISLKPTLIFIFFPKVQFDGNNIF